MANILSLLFVFSCIGFAGVLFQAQAQSTYFIFPPATNFSLEGIASYLQLLPLMNGNLMELSNGDKTQATFSWMTYNQPISLWDNSSFLANFSSHFKFLVSTSDHQSSHYRGGLAFFLTPSDLEPPLNCEGQWLGLFNQSTEGNSSNQIVAVEFDKLKNDPFDPDDNHMGINVNSIVSKEDLLIKGLPFFSVSNRQMCPCGINIESRFVAKAYRTHVAGFALLAGLYYFRNKSREEEDIEMDKWFSEGPRKFSHAELSAATHKFSQEQKLGGGGLGDVYRGILPGAKEAVAVKRISQRFKQGKKEYISEVTIISKLRHRNLVQLFGWSHRHQKGELLLVYEFLPNGSLDKYLFGGICLDWDRRYVILRDMTAALFYLNEYCKERVVHRDVKASNIMMDPEHRAKLGDFGLARLSAGNFGNSASTVIAATVGYIAQNGMCPALEGCVWKLHAGGGWRLVEWVWDLHFQEKLLTAADERLNGNFDGKEMERVLQLGLLCSHPDPKARPSMRKVLNILRLEAKVPDVPLTYPVTMYGGTLGYFEASMFPMLGKISTPANYEKFLKLLNDLPCRKVVLHGSRIIVDF
ncbi:L-type lectin-domain containing receptor kinase IV.1-like [Cryptomeria japonica]|uniref:L-type lectin-domain containing receptor kinase IV.1-like n=1 Tax=Cryptomeria japonica TaxID=3369 RepID=UPI0027DA5B02|nr:L-type lectin-domain containing receptor kinase IV.1-like [Cryptomeria japonica]